MGFLEPHISLMLGGIGVFITNTSDITKPFHLKLAALRCHQGHLSPPKKLDKRLRERLLS
jgi:hypothetical protein